MKTRTIITTTFALLAVALAGCSSNPSPEETSASDEPLANEGGGASGDYTCTDAGFCQCKGLEACDNMFLVCKSHTYCNYDKAGGFRCCCWNFTLQTTQPPPRPGGGGTVGVFK